MIGESLEEGLRKENYAVDWAKDGNEAELALRTHTYDLILLDLALPKKKGIDVLSQFRKNGGNTPVLIITARDAIPDRIQGLDKGADDYLVKPFDLYELFARIRALLRRQSGSANPELSFGGITLYPAMHTASLNDNPINLSAREFALLQALMAVPGNVVSRETLEEKLYGWNDEVESNTVEVYIHALRKKLGNEAIKNIRGVGYKLVATK
jgi:two-component system OmpR family response regulator/two-component system response regulator QseB